MVQGRRRYLCQFIERVCSLTTNANMQPRQIGIFASTKSGKPQIETKPLLSQHSNIQIPKSGLMPTTNIASGTSTTASAGSGTSRSRSRSGSQSQIQEPFQGRLRGGSQDPKVTRKAVATPTTANANATPRPRGQTQPRVVMETWDTTTGAPGDGTQVVIVTVPRAPWVAVISQPRVWVLSVYAVLVLGLFVERSLREPGFVRHFTYWSLAASLVWAVSWLVVIAKGAVRAERGSATTATTSTTAEFTPEAVFLAFTALPVLGILTTVGILITALPLFDNSMIEAQVEDVPLSVANAANLGIHYLPLVVMALLVVATWPAVAGAIGVACARLEAVTGTGPVLALRVGTAVVLAAGVPGAFAAMYAAVFDFTVEYDAHVDPAAVFSVGLIGLVLLTGIHFLSSGKALSSARIASRQSFGATSASLRTLASTGFRG